MSKKAETEITEKAIEEVVETEEAEEEEGPIHPLQKLMDNPWLLLLLGLLIPILSYTVWGWVELSQVAPAQLP